MAEENPTYKFTILGETGSGKTCYLLGMYFEMTMGVAGYTLLADNPDEDKDLSLRYEMLNDKERGQNRFPDPSDSMQKYNFSLQYAYEDILPFEWVDYPGGWLDPKIKDTNNAQYQEVAKNIKESSALFICIDGANLVGNNKRAKIQKVKTRCVRNIGPYLGGFNGNLPPIAMLITKYDMCESHTNPNEIREIIETAFEALFEREDAFISIIPVSLGATLEDDSYAGDLEPINIHLPILMGIDFALVEILNYIRKLTDQQNRDIANAKAARDKEADSFFLWRDDDYIKRANEYIDEENNYLKNNLRIAKYFKKSLNRVSRDLEDVNMIFFNGSWQDRRTIHKMWDDLHSVVEYF